MHEVKHVELKFRIPAVEMVDAADQMTDDMEHQLDAFILKDADMNSDFIIAIRAAIAAAQASPADTTIDAEQKGLTDAVDALMVKCRDKYQDAKYYIEKKAFKDESTVWNEFGANTYENARKNTVLMIKFMENFSSKANFYKVKLIAAKYLQLQIDEILTLHDSLNAAHKAQQDFIRHHPVQTTDRNKLFNIVWDNMVLVSQVGQRVNVDNYDLLQLFLLPFGSTTGQKISASGKAFDSITLAPLKQVKVIAVEKNIVVYTNINGNYQIAGLNDGLNTLLFEFAEYNLMQTTVNIQPNTPAVKDVALVKAGTATVIFKSQIAVSLIALPNVNYQILDGEGGNTGATASKTITNLQPGTHPVTFFFAGFQTQILQVPLVAGDNGVIYAKMVPMPPI